LADLCPIYRDAKSARLLAGSTAGIVFNEHTDEDGPTVFQHACRFGFEGIVPTVVRLLL
jgi:hypothetical protein